VLGVVAVRILVAIHHAAGPLAAVDLPGAAIGPAAGAPAVAVVLAEPLAGVLRARAVPGRLAGAFCGLAGNAAGARLAGRLAVAAAAGAVAVRGVPQAPVDPRRIDVAGADIHVRAEWHDRDIDVAVLTGGRLELVEQFP